MNSGFNYLGVTPAGFVEGVKAELPLSFQQEVPSSKAGQTDFSGIGQAVERNPLLGPAWHRTAVTLIARILMRDNKITNPMSEFEGELVENGNFIEEMIIDTAKAFMFDPSKAVMKIFDRREPRLRALIHQHKRDVIIPTTLQDTYYPTIFRTPAELNRYVINVAQSLVSSNESGKYFESKAIVSKAAAAGSIRTIDLGATVTYEDLQEQILTHSKQMLQPSRFYNMGNIGQLDNEGETGIEIQADRNELRMLLPISTSVGLDVKFFANAFHLDPVKSNLVIKEINSFPSIHEYNKDHTITQTDIANGFINDYNFEVGEILPAGTIATEKAYRHSIATGENDIDLVYDASRIKAVILDRRALLINPIIPVTFSNDTNGQGRYVNITLHDKGYFSFSPFMPSVVILADEVVKNRPVQDVQIDNESILNKQTGIANIPYTEETGTATDEVFPEVTMSNKKEEITAYLDSKNIKYDENMTKADLLALI